MCEAKPNSVFSSSDIESREVLTNRGKKKISTFFSKLFDMWSHYYFRKKDGFQGDPILLVTTTVYTMKVISLPKVLKPTNERTYSHRPACVFKVLK